MRIPDPDSGNGSWTTWCDGDPCGGDTIDETTEEVVEVGNKTYHRECAPPVEVIRIIFTAEDVQGMAEQFGIDPKLALDRALDWGRHIADTMTGYCAEQLESAIRFDQP